MQKIKNRSEPENFFSLTEKTKKQRNQIFYQITPLLDGIINLVEEFLPQKVEIAAGRSHSLILLESGQILVTGYNNSGQLGAGNYKIQNIPVLMNLKNEEKEEESKAIAIAAGSHHSLILLESGQILATGCNRNGQLGIMNSSHQTRPVLMNLRNNKREKEAKAIAVAGGDEHSMILLQSGQVLVTGGNVYGQLGIGNCKIKKIPVPMNLGKNENGENRKAVAIAAGSFHSLTLLESGQVLAAGENEHGQLGIGNCNCQKIPVPMNLGKNENGENRKAVAIAAGGHHSLILLEGGQVLGTGRNANGQLGIGDYDYQTTPVFMKLGKNENGEERKAIAISASYFHSLVLLDNGQVLAAGSNYYGQLGLGSRFDEAIPILMNLGENEKGKERKAVAVSAGYLHSLIALDNGQILGTGQNAYGELGIGNFDLQKSPILMK